MNFVRAIAIVVVMAVISGCASAPKKASPEQSAASARFYPGKTSAELKEAAVKTLTALAPDSMKVEVQENGVRARYNYSYMARRIGYVGSTTTFYNSVAEGSTWYNVVLQEQAGGTEARFTYLHSAPAGIFHPGFKSNLPVLAESNIEEFKLFHDRMEYYAGIRPDWTPCPDAPAEERRFVEICDRAGMNKKAP